jgi:glucose/arabinose dehydrogenase
MSFSIDGKLYIGTGETHYSANAQTLDNRLGKILRINANGSIPSDNPFFGTATGNNRAIWAMGLRNPYVFAFQPGTGRMFINDVGQDNYEEINDGIAGKNYGWPCREGNNNGPNTGLCGGGVTLTSPLYTYPHPSIGGSVTGCAITGGAFYNPTTVQFPASYVGKYFFADYCNRWITGSIIPVGAVYPVLPPIPGTRWLISK